MSFSEVPKEAKSKIDKAGRKLLLRDIDSREFTDAKELVENWRACHAYPINTFQATLRSKTKKFSNPIVVQRLKRMPTIIDKLRRYPSMKLTRMQDIGGVRAILDSIDDVYRLASEYRDESRFYHNLVNEKDYIKTPRDQDGYRSLHLVYRYKNKAAPAYDGLLLELQIRTRLQHIWATAVETAGIILNQALKSRQGDQEWLDFFALVSSAFAYMENSNLVPRYSKLSREDTFKKVYLANKNLGVLEKIHAYSLVAKVITEKTKEKKDYYLIILDLPNRTAHIQMYKRKNLTKALDDYAFYENEAELGKGIESVLVSANSMEALKQAYPNFFLDVKDFVNKVNDIIKEVEK